MMCDNPINKSIDDGNMNIPLVPNEESTKMEASTTKSKEDVMGSTNALAPTEAHAVIKQEAHHDYSSSSSGEEDDDDDDDDDDEEEDNNNIGKAPGGTPDGTSSMLQIPLRYTKSGRKRSIPFPVRLMTVLSDPKFHHIIEWLPSGKSFVIYKPKVFATDILPSRFKSAKYSSFTRKLHRWGFVRHFRGGDSGAFFHPHFQKGRLDLAESMTCCQQQKEAASKKARKAKINNNKSQATSDPSSRLSASIRKSGIANFRNVMGGSTTNDALRQNQAQLLSLVGNTQSMRLPLMSNMGVSSGVADALQDFSSHSLPGVMSNGRTTLNQYADMLGAASLQNRQQGKYPGMSLDSTSSDLVAQHQQQAIMKARLDAAIKEELARIEFARLTKERLATANAVHRYNALLQHQQQRQRSSNNSMLLGALPSGSEGVLGGMSSSSPFLGSVPSSSSPSMLGGGSSQQMASLGPVLGQLSRAELEQYALAMSTRNSHPASQLPPSTNFPTASNLRGARRSNPF